MRVLIAGGRGFIGSALKKALEAEDHQVNVISRSKGISWNQIRSEGLPPCDALIHLAGASVMGKRWSEKVKRELFSSRVDTARILVDGINRSESPPEVFISASAVGFYPSDGQIHSEESGPGDDFLARLAKQMEVATELPNDSPTRRVVMRIGLALDSQGGALKKMLPAFKWGLGGPIGNGKQGFAWIHIEDLVGLFLFALGRENVLGPINAVAPQCVSQKEFAKALGKALRRPALLPTPPFLLKALLGERADLLLRSPFVAPKRAVELGYTFSHPELDEALRSLL